MDEGLVDLLYKYVLLRTRILKLNFLVRGSGKLDRLAGNSEQAEKLSIGNFWSYINLFTVGCRESLLVASVDPSAIFFSVGQIKSY